MKEIFIIILLIVTISYGISISKSNNLYIEIVKFILLMLLIFGVYKMIII